MTQISNRIYTRVLEVTNEGKITYEFIGGLYYNKKSQMEKCSYGERTRFYASSKTELVNLLKCHNLYS